MYADNTHITLVGSNLDDKENFLNRDLNNTNKRLITNKLTLNMTKTEFMLIGSRQKLNTLTQTAKFFN